MSTPTILLLLDQYTNQSLQSIGETSKLTEDDLSTFSLPIEWADIIRYGGTIDLRNLTPWKRNNVRSAIGGNSLVFLQH